MTPTGPLVTCAIILVVALFAAALGELEGFKDCLRDFRAGNDAAEIARLTAPYAEPIADLSNGALPVVRPGRKVMLVTTSPGGAR